MTTLFFIMLAVTLLNVYGIYRSARALRVLRQGLTDLEESKRIYEAEIGRARELQKILEPEVIRHTSDNIKKERNGESDI